MPEFEAEPIRQEVHHRSLEEFISIGMELREKKDNISWDYGDLAIEVTNAFGSKYLKEFCKGVGIPVESIRRYRDVSKAYPNKEFRESVRALSWSHFRVVAAQLDREQLLIRAHDDSWSVEKLAEMTRTRKQKEQQLVDDGLPVPPKPELYFCPGCRHWYILSAEECPSEGKCPELSK